THIGGVTTAATATGKAASEVLANARELDTQSGMLRSAVDEFLVKVRAAWGEFSWISAQPPTRLRRAFPVRAVRCRLRQEIYGVRFIPARQFRTFQNRYQPFKLNLESLRTLSDSPALLLYPH